MGGEEPYSILSYSTTCSLLEMVYISLQTNKFYISYLFFLCNPMLSCTTTHNHLFLIPTHTYTHIYTYTHTALFFLSLSFPTPTHPHQRPLHRPPAPVFHNNRRSVDNKGRLSTRKVIRRHKKIKVTYSTRKKGKKKE